MPALAITDHGNMFGAIDFYLQAIEMGIKPIIGCEIYVAPTSRFDKSVQINQEMAHLVLLVKDETGYKNILKLVSAAYLEGFYYKPRIDKEILSAHAEGLIGLSSCLQGGISKFLKADKINDAIKEADEYNKIFGKGNFYLELQDNGITEQKQVNKKLIKLSEELDIGLVATNDVHYLTKETAFAHEVLLGIQTQTTLQDEKRMRFETEEFYFKSPEEMKELFKEVPSAIKNTISIAERCNLELKFNQIHLPRYDPPSGISKEEFLDKLCQEALPLRYPELTSDITDRLTRELKVIKDMGFLSYFLIVWDFIHYAKENNIPVGPGRGSAAGSIVSYLLGITDIDPLKYGLLFERFLNPQRLSLPDIDIDFCYERRNEVIDYVTNKYGNKNVAQIITFGTMLARAAVRDVGRVMGMSYADVDRIAKMIPPDPNIKLKDAIKLEPELEKLYESDSRIAQLLNIACILEGLSRHASVHAAGVVISDKELTEYVPLFRASDTQITTGYSMDILEKIGLLKMDFLGLRTLTVIDKAVKIIKKTKGIDVNIAAIALDDSNTFKLLAKANTVGIFQVESAGMRDLLRKLQAERFEDLIALLALYRPGPIGSGMLDDFIQRRHKKVSINYEHKVLEAVLKETYGIFVYQEQVMQIAYGLAGFSMEQADLLRRAMSKKNPEAMEKQRAIFIEGAVKNKVKKPSAEKIFDLIEYFSGYGFNKSHSAAYALISYRTAYLKANFPTEFMTALLTSERDNTDKIVEYVSECSRMGITVLPPDINKSEAEFKCDGERSIRFGLLAIKNVGTTAINSIINARENGEFKSLNDICERVDLRVVNHKVLESLIKCGCLDSFGFKRAQLMNILDNCIERSSSLQRERSRGQLSFFNDYSENVFKDTVNLIPNINEWPEPQVLAFEKELLGFYISGHPLAKYSRQIKRFHSFTTNDLKSCSDGQEVKLAGLIYKIKQTTTRKTGEKMAILMVEDLEGSVEVLVFPKTYKKVNQYLLDSNVVFVVGRVDLKEEMPKIIANDMFMVDNAYDLISSVNIELSNIRENLFDSLKNTILSHPGKTPIYLHISTPNRPRIRIAAGEELFVNVNEDFLDDLEGLLGEESFALRF